MTFGSFIRKKRLAQKIMLRDFSAAVGISAVYASNIESGIRPAPSQKILLKIAKTLNLNEKERAVMFDLAAESKNTPTLAIDLVKYMNNNKSARSALRKAKNCKASKEDWDRFTNYLSEKYE